MTRGRMRELKGTVIKNSADKTLMVQIETSSKNRTYNKIVVLKRSFMCMMKRMKLKLVIK